MFCSLNGRLWFCYHPYLLFLIFYIIFYFFLDISPNTLFCNMSNNIYNWGWRWVDQTFRMPLSLICAHICYIIALSSSLKELSHNSPHSINLCNLILILETYLYIFLKDLVYGEWFGTQNSSIESLLTFDWDGSFCGHEEGYHDVCPLFASFLFPSLRPTLPLCCPTSKYPH